MASIPATMKALVLQADKTAKVEVVPVPEIADDEILVKTVALAQNPTDWKGIARGIGPPGCISGCDWSGYVVKTGKNVSTLAVGAHVAGFVMGATFKDRGAFAEYLKTSADLAWVIPDNTISDEQAATLGCSFWTAVQALFHPTRLGLVEPPSKTEKAEWIVIYGGSSSVGMFAIQLAHLAGYKVATTASPRNHELVKSLGADLVVDYKDPNAIQAIKDATGNSIHAGLDTICTAETQSFTISTFAPGEGKLLVILAPSEDAQKLREDVKIQFTLLYTALGREFNYTRFFPASPEDKAHMAQFLTKVPELVKSGQVKPNPTKLFEGGLEGINAGLKYMQDGNVSGEKIVYRLSN